MEISNYSIVAEKLAVRTRCLALVFLTACLELARGKRLTVGMDQSRAFMTLSAIPGGWHYSCQHAQRENQILERVALVEKDNEIVLVLRTAFGRNSSSATRTRAEFRPWHFQQFLWWRQHCGHAASLELSYNR